ncbi:MAG: hypothetical protein PHQ89_03340 [Bacilli bacterium]|nr:hypothetical protein [Bacilli bacterium]
MFKLSYTKDGKEYTIKEMFIHSKIVQKLVAIKDSRAVRTGNQIKGRFAAANLLAKASRLGAAETKVQEASTSLTGLKHQYENYSKDKAENDNRNIEKGLTKTLAATDKEIKKATKRALKLEKKRDRYTLNEKESAALKNILIALNVAPAEVAKEETKKEPLAADDFLSRAAAVQNDTKEAEKVPLSELIFNQPEVKKELSDAEKYQAEADYNKSMGYKESKPFAEKDLKQAWLNQEEAKEKAKPEVEVKPVEVNQEEDILDRVASYIEDLELKNVKKDEMINNLNNDLNKKDLTIDKLNIDLIETDKDIKELNNNLRQKDETIKKLEIQVADNAAIMENQVRQRTQELEELRVQLLKIQNENNSLKQENISLKESANHLQAREQKFSALLSKINGGSNSQEMEQTSSMQR